MDKKISIVTAYYNRREQFNNTLKSILESEHANYEIIIVDDGSDDNHRIENLVEKYDFIKLIRIEEQDRYYINPCIPFNIGFSAATGEIIMLQNPECFHVNDILKYVNDNLCENDYISFGAYSLNMDQTNEICKISENIIENAKKIVEPYKNVGAINEIGCSWYNHSIFRPVGYHFCSAIYRSNLIKLNGFDERYGYGISYDDNEFLRRVYWLGLNVKIIDDYHVYHQYHDHSNRKLKNHSLLQDNRKLFQMDEEHKIISVNQNKKIIY